MTKHEAAWLSVRLTGVVVALFGLKQTPTIMFLIWLFASGGMRNAKTDIAVQYEISSTWPIALGALILLSIACYLLLAGRAIHKMLMKE
jgi:hypothetical protein